MSRPARRVAVAGVAALLVALLPLAPVSAAPLATLSITSPVTGSGVVPDAAGTITIDGSTDGSATPTVVSVSVDGTPVVGSPFACTVTVFACHVAAAWDSSLLAVGGHTIVATLNSDTVAALKSATAAVHLSVPTLSITSPVNGVGVVPGVSGSIVVDGSTDGSGVPTSVAVTVDGVALPGSPFSCTVTVFACHVAAAWDSSLLAVGGHTIVATLNSDTTSSVKSATSTVHLSRPTVTITPPSGDILGAFRIVVSGTPDGGATPTAIELSVDGTLLGTPSSCPGSAATPACSASVVWDSSGAANGSHVIVARLVAGAALLATDSLTVTVANPLPSVMITSPTTASAVVGVTSVAVLASTDTALTDYPASIAVSDGSTVIGTVTCSPPSHTCDGAVSWDATSLSGARTLTAAVTTTHSVSARSAPVAVTVRNPVPTVSITSPGASDVVSGSVSVRVTGSTDPRRSDLPDRFSLLVDGVGLSTATCSTATHDCALVLTWGASRSVGAHTVVVTMSTTSGATASSPSVLVFVSSASRVVLGLPKIVSSGSTVVVTGRVVAATTGRGVPGVSVTVKRLPVVGAASSVRVVTGVGGVFTVRYVARANATVTAVVARRPWLATSRGTTPLRVAAPMTCNVTTRTLAVGAVGRGACSVPGLPAGTRLSLRYIVGGRLATLASGSARGAAIPYSFGFPTPGVYLLRIDLLATKVYVATSSSLIRVVVR